MTVDLGIATLLCAMTFEGGIRMNAKDYWLLFMDSGAPELYVQYRAKMMEENHVFDDTGDRPESYGFQ